MELQQYVEEKREIQENLIKYIDNQNDEDDFILLTNILEKQNILENRQDLKLFLHLIIKISDNHGRKNSFFEKINRILSYIKEKIKQTFSNAEIFDLFHKSKRILLYFIDQKIIILNDQYLQRINDSEFNDFCRFFYPEIELIVETAKIELIERQLLKYDEYVFDNFDQKRLLGENDSYICSLIRNDLIDDFVAYVNQANFQLSSNIKLSPFETNSFLLKQKSTNLIEYAAFFGSIQIFNFLRLNNVKLSKSLWLYAIHGRNAEMIHLLEENHVEVDDQTYVKCLYESIKCHHNEIAIYFKDNYLNEKVKDEDIIKYGIQFYNYSYFPIDLNNDLLFYFFCKYDYCDLVDLLLKTKEIYVNKPMFDPFQNLKKIY